MKSLKFSWKYALILAGMALLAYLVVELNSRTAKMRSLSEQRDLTSAEATQVMQTQAALSTQIAVATSEAAVAPWAYGEGHMAQPGDNTVVLVPGSSPVAPTQVPVLAQPVVQNWQLWLWLFYDPR